MIKCIVGGSVTGVEGNHHIRALGIGKIPHISNAEGKTAVTIFFCKGIAVIDDLFFQVKPQNFSGNPPDFHQIVI